MKKFFIVTLLTIAVAITAQAQTRTVTTTLNVRQQPTTNSQIINVLPQGTQVETIDSSTYGWDKIDFGDYVGYVCDSYVAATAGYEQSVNSVQETLDTSLPALYAKEEFIHQGVINWNGWNWTYYLLSMFPGLTSTPVQGRYVNEDGFVCDGDGYVILASVDLPPYTVVETPFGYMGKVYDTGCPHGVIDVYTNFY